MFNIAEAISPSSLNQLFQAYTDAWNGYYSIQTLYTLWYYTDTSNNNIINCRMYYEYTGGGNGYWCNYMNYNTTTGLYVYVGDGVSATSTNSGLSPEDLALLTIYYASTTPISINTSEELYIFLNGPLQQGMLTQDININFNLTSSTGFKSILSNYSISKTI